MKRAMVLERSTWGAKYQLNEIVSQNGNVDYTKFSTESIAGESKSVLYSVFVSFFGPFFVHCDNCIIICSS